VRIPRFRIRTLMIAVVVVSGLLAIAINVRRSNTPAMIVVTVVNETGADLAVSGISWEPHTENALQRTCQESLAQKMGLGETTLPPLPCGSGAGTVRIFVPNDSGVIVSSEAEIHLVGGSLYHVQCRVGRDARGVFARMRAVGPPVGMIAAWDYGTALVAVVLLLLPALIITAIIVSAFMIFRQDARYAERLRRSYDIPKICPWPPDLSETHETR
jgi:hypothetical protein